VNSSNALSSPVAAGNGNGNKRKDSDGDAAAVNVSMDDSVVGFSSPP
jgi:hypothetical protein